MDHEPPNEVVELDSFIDTARRVLSEEERSALVDYLAWNPTAGDLIKGTGGVRKLRWAVQGRGKSGGARVIYYYHDPNVPLFLLTLYVKGRKAALTDKELNEMRAFVRVLVEQHKR